MHRVAPDRQLHALPGHRFRLLYFVLGSLLAHALLVGLWRGEPPAGPAGQSTFEVTVLARRGNAPAMPGGDELRRTTQDPRQPANGGAAEGAVSAAAELASHTPLDVSRNADRVQAPAPEKRGPAPIDARHQADGPKTSGRAVGKEGMPRLGQSVRDIPGNAGARPGLNSDGQHALTSAARYRKVRAELRKALLPYFEYPAVARRRGWQGRVSIGMLVEADGDLVHVQLIESSGHALLDSAAVRNVRELSRVPAAIPWLEGRDMDVILPVSYRLEDR